MNIKVYWIPKSARGREVGRELKERGHDVRIKDVTGRYVGNLDLDLTAEDLRAIAYILAPELAAGEEESAYLTAEKIRDNPRAFGIAPQDAEAEAAASKTPG